MASDHRTGATDDETTRYDGAPDTARTPAEPWPFTGAGRFTDYRRFHYGNSARSREADARTRTGDPFITRERRVRDARPRAGTISLEIGLFRDHYRGRACPRVPELTYPFRTSNATREQMSNRRDPRPGSTPHSICSQGRTASEALWSRGRLGSGVRTSFDVPPEAVRLLGGRSLARSFASTRA